MLGLIHTYYKLQGLQLQNKCLLRITVAVTSPPKTVSTFIFLSMKDKPFIRQFQTSNSKMKSLILITIISFSIFNYAFATQILSKSKLEKCEKVSDSQGLNCTSKIILDLAVPSESVHKNYFVFFDLYIFLKSFSLW